MRLVLSSKKKVVHWFRRDLRILDNRGLFHACKSEAQILPIFIFDPDILKKFKDKKDRRVQFLWESLLDLSTAIDKKGGKLRIFYGKPADIYKKLIEDGSIQAVYCNEDYEPAAIARDEKISKLLAKSDIEFHSFKDQVVFRGDEVLKKDDTPYRVFTPYKKVWLSKVGDDDLGKHIIREHNFVKKLSTELEQVTSLKEVGFEPIENVFKGGRTEAKKLFLKFLPIISEYKNNRDYVFKDTNSNLSPHLRFGNLSIRELVRQSIKIRTDGARTWLSELIWREFYQMILFQFPHVVDEAFQKKRSDLKWKGSDEHFKLWKEGKTGFPLIDAAMIRFKKTGLMHNRLRMVVASFLTKDLLVSWQKGEEYFAQKLFDFDLASNNGGWQWSASTGVDAQPYFRVFNPYSQSERFDKEATFILSQLPQLKNLPKKFIHKPHLAPLKVQEEAGCLVGQDYPEPIVDHAGQRLAAIEMFKDP